MSENLFELFRSKYQAETEKIFLAQPEAGNYTFGEIDTLSGRFARLLMDRDVTPGDRVVVQTDKSPAAVALYLACLRIGAVFVPLNTAYTPREVNFFIGDAGPKVFICRPKDLEAYQAGAETTGLMSVLGLGAEPGSGIWSAKVSNPYDDCVSRDASDLAAILYTSGTTGRSKGAMITHANLASNAINLHQIWGFEPGDVLLHALPVFHVHGLFVALHCALLNASTVLFLARFDVSEVLVSLDKATVMMGVPTFYTRLLDEKEFGPDTCQNIRLFISGSAPMTEATHAAFTRRTGHQILERYGMTEAGMITSNPLDGERIPGTVGYPLPGTEIRIVDEQGKRRSPGETGSIEVHGPNVFPGYWRLPEKTAEDFRDDGFFITGDLGYVSVDNRLSIAGREKDLIISGGYNIYPKEIELLLDNMNGIQESAVIGAPHPDLGESVIAILVADGENNPAEKKVLKDMEDKLARFKQPRRCIYVDELPRNTMGKVQKNLLREQYKNTFAQETTE